MFLCGDWCCLDVVGISVECCSSKNRIGKNSQTQHQKMPINLNDVVGGGGVSDGCGVLWVPRYISYDRWMESGFEY